MRQHIRVSARDGTRFTDGTVLNTPKRQYERRVAVLFRNKYSMKQDAIAYAKFAVICFAILAQVAGQGIWKL